MLATEHGQYDRSVGLRRDISTGKPGVLRIRSVREPDSIPESTLAERMHPQGRSGTMISTNGGATWTQYSETAYTVFATESNVYFAGGGMLLIGSPVPAPGAIALLGVAGAVSGRRRRG